MLYKSSIMLTIKPRPNGQNTVVWLFNYELIQHIIETVVKATFSP